MLITIEKTIQEMIAQYFRLNKRAEWAYKKGLKMGCPGLIVRKLVYKAICFNFIIGSVHSLRMKSREL